MSTNFKPVELYVKISCDVCPQAPWQDSEWNAIRQPTGDEVFDYLMQDKIQFGEFTYNEETYEIEGDKLIWYMCTAEKVGVFKIGDWTLDLKSGDCTPHNIKMVVDELLKQEFITQQQYDILLEEIEFCRTHFNLYFDIQPYLTAKQILDGFLVNDNDITPKISISPIHKS